MSYSFTLEGWGPQLELELTEAARLVGSKTLNDHVAQALTDGADMLLEDGSGTRHIKGFAAHIVDEAPEHHDTARRLGANPTNYYEAAASGIDRRGTATEAILTFVNGAGAMARAFADVTIYPGPGHQWLTCANIAEAYGKRAGEFGDRLQFQPRGPDLALLTWKTATSFGVLKSQARKAPPQAATAVTASTAAKAATPQSQAAENVPVVYWLRKSAFQKQDPSLAPPDAVIYDLMSAGAYNAMAKKFPMLSNPNQSPST